MTTPSLTTIFPKCVGLFLNAFAQEPDEQPSLGQMLERIRSDEWKEPILLLRKRLEQGSRKKYNESKRSLAAFTLSASCLTRAKDVPLDSKMTGHSGWLQADLDAKDNPQLADLDEVRRLLVDDPHIGFVFVSPSGQGLKAGVRIDGDRHSEAFFAAEDYFLHKYGLQIDRSTKDPLRLCFVSWDPDLQWKEADPLPIPESQPAGSTSNNWQPPLETTAEDIREMLKHVAPRPAYEDWLRIASAVWSVLPMAEGCQVLAQWSPEEKPGEYTEKWKHKLDHIGIGTLVFYAKQGGFDARAASRRKNWAGRIRFADPTARDGLETFEEDPGKDVAQVELTREFVEACYRQNQRGDAALIARIFESKKLYDHYGKVWRTYKDGIWQRDEMQGTLVEASDSVAAAYQELADTIRKDIDAHPAPDPKKDPRVAQVAGLEKRIQKIRSMGYLSGCLTFAESILGTVATEFDQHPGLLVVNNGVLDFGNGVFREHRPADRATYKTPCDFNPDAECPRWTRFLEFFMQEDQSLIDYLARAAGYSLTGYVDKDVLFFLYGKGANGKSTYTSTMKMLAGDLMTTVPIEALMAKASDNNFDYRKAQMEGKRIVVSDEIPEERRLNESSIKSLVGGDDITARRPYEKPYVFTPTHKLWLVGNHKPKIAGTDHGIWRRVHLIPWLNTMPEDERRPRHEILAEFRTELPGILNWAIRGYIEMIDQGGLQPPGAVIEATKEYQKDSDQFARFMEERTENQWGLTTSLTNLRETYQAWCQDEGEEPRYQSNQKISHYLRDQGWEVSRSGNRKERHVLGLHIRDYQLTA